MQVKIKFLLKFTTMISYLIIVHNNPTQLKRLITSLQSSNAKFFIHVDSKVDITPFCDTLKAIHNVHFIEKRTDVQWGSYSYIELYFNSVKEIAQIAPDSFVILLSGFDYPIQSTEKISNFVNQNKDKIFIQTIKMPNPCWSGSGGIDRFKTYNHLIKGRKYISIKPLTLSVTNVRYFIKTIIRKPSLTGTVIKNFFTPRHYPIEGTQYYGGEIWVSMNEKIANSIGHYIEGNPQLQEFYKPCCHPEEIMLQTLIVNNEQWRQKTVNHTLRYVDWTGIRGQYPATFSIEEKELINEKSKELANLFARKFDVNFDEKILDYIDELRK